MTSLEQLELVEHEISQEAHRFYVLLVIATRAWSETDIDEMDDAGYAYILGCTEPRIGELRREIREALERVSQNAEA